MTHRRISAVCLTLLLTLAGSSVATALNVRPGEDASPILGDVPNIHVSPDCKLGLQTWISPNGEDGAFYFDARRVKFAIGRIALDAESCREGVFEGSNADMSGMTTPVYYDNGSGNWKLIPESTSDFFMSSMSGSTFWSILMTERDAPYRLRAKWTPPGYSQPIIAENVIYIGADVGVSIDSDAVATNSTKVMLDFNPPANIIGAQVSNDGSFRTKSTFMFKSPVSMEWNIRGGIGATRVVYVRYLNSDHTKTATYSDDIIYDVVAPTVSGASVTGTVSSQSLSPRAGKNPTVVLKVLAKDDRSGINVIEIKRERGGSSVKKFSRTYVLPAAGGAISVRVRDGAGNWSTWRKAK